MRHKQWAIAVLFATAALAVVWAVGHASAWGRERVFRGKPESYWVTNVSYSPTDAEVKQWQSFGPDGVRVLIRGLERASPPWQRIYRSLYKQAATRLPGTLTRFLPYPQDRTRATRMCLISLLCNLDTNAVIAEPIAARMLWDHDPSVRQLAINFFTWGENEKALLNQLGAREKRRLLPCFLRDLRDQTSGNWGLRNNAAIALRYYPEHRQTVSPALVAAMKDTVPTVRLMVAEALNQIDPETAKRVQVVSVVIPIAKDPDDQVAYRAVQLLGKMKNDTELTVPALLEALENTNTLVACSAVWVFNAGRQFDPYGDRIVPALTKAAQRKDDVAGYARNALKRFQTQ